MKWNCRIGFSVYVSTFEKQKSFLEKLRGKDLIIFTSFHIQEEFCTDYKTTVIDMMTWLHENGFKVIADVSKRTLNQLEYSSLKSLLKDINIDVLRIDYGYSDNELNQMSQDMPLMVNASTTSVSMIGSLKTINENLLSCHNFYPRPETGLSIERFIQINNDIREINVPVLAFVPGSKKRGPINEGLPTLESHRYKSPYVSMLDMLIVYEVDSVIVGDLELESDDLDHILRYIQTDEISIPVSLDSPYDALYDQSLTIRIDSGAFAFRIDESREYASQNSFCVDPIHSEERSRGCITIDNDLYGRYVGEMQIIHTDLSADKKVNVIGQIEKEYLDLLNIVKGGSIIRFVRS